ncbi:hypothetical protein VCHA53O466_140201 [Vibrio chagasii]|nr:hypothetical protein VCHA53O466_140201 [Vibrio chagasii]
MTQMHNPITVIPVSRHQPATTRDLSLFPVLKEDKRPFPVKSDFIVGAIGKDVIAEGNLKITDASSVMDLINYNALGGTKEDLISLNENTPERKFSRFEIVVHVFVNDFLAETYKQNAIFEGDKPDLMPLGAVLNLLTTDSIDAGLYEQRWKSGEEDYSDYELRHVAEVEMVVAYNKL